MISASFRRSIQGAVAAGDAAAASPLLTGLVYCYSFENDGNDSHTNGLHLTGVNAPGFVAGKVGQATDFVLANQQYWTRAHSALQNVGLAYTIAGFVNVKTNYRGDTIIRKGSFEYWLYHQESDKLALYTGSAPLLMTGLFTMGVGWHFVAAWWNQAGNQIGIRLDNLAPVTTTWATVTGSSAALFVGARLEDSYYPYANASVDQLMAWNFPLSTAQLNWLYNSGQGRAYAELASGPAT